MNARLSAPCRVVEVCLTITNLFGPGEDPATLDQAKDVCRILGWGVPTEDGGGMFTVSVPQALLDTANDCGDFNIRVGGPDGFDIQISSEDG